MEELTKEKRIQEEIDRLTVFYDDVDEAQKAVVTPLIKNAAFMRVTLEDLQDQINEEGPVDEYQNGEGQFGKKQSAALQSYNALLKSYSNTTKLLFTNLSYIRKESPTEWMMRQRESIEQDVMFRYKLKYGPLDEDDQNSEPDEEDLKLKTLR